MEPTSKTTKILYMAIAAVLVGIIVSRTSYDVGLELGEAAGFKRGLEAGLLAGSAEGYDLGLTDRGSL